jgi:hypothetical protein
MLQLTITNGNATSSAFNIAVNATEPGLLGPTSFKIGEISMWWRNILAAATYFRLAR